MLAQFLGRARHAGGGQVAGRGAGHEPRRRDAPGDEVRGAQVAHAHGDVHAFGLHIDVTIVEAHFERDLGIALRELRDGGQQQVLAEGHGHVDAQLALRPVARQAQLVVGGVDLRQDAPAMLQVDHALRRDRYLARGAVEQAGAEVLLELGDVAAGHGARHVEGARRRGQTSRDRRPGRIPAWPAADPWRGI